METQLGSDARERFVRRETLVNTVATIVVALLLTWLMFRGETAIAVRAPPPGGVFGILPGTFNFTLLVTLVLTLVVRGRVRRGEVPRMPGDDRGRDRLPRNLLLRALALAALATLVLVPLSGGTIWALVGYGALPSHWSLGGMAFYYAAHFAVLALIVTPVVVRRALRD